jgi:hypothetical protein
MIETSVMTVTFYVIKNFDTMKNAFDWLDTYGGAKSTIPSYYLGKN